LTDPPPDRQGWAAPPAAQNGHYIICKGLHRLGLAPRPGAQGAGVVVWLKLADIQSIVISAVAAPVVGTSCRSLSHEVDDILYLSSSLSLFHRSSRCVELTGCRETASPATPQQIAKQYPSLNLHRQNAHHVLLARAARSLLRGKKYFVLMGQLYGEVILQVWNPGCAPTP
jgi:hypothetical protein